MLPALHCTVKLQLAGLHSKVPSTGASLNQRLEGQWEPSTDQLNPSCRHARGKGPATLRRAGVFDADRRQCGAGLRERESCYARLR